jgi:MFS family permease
LYAVGAFLTAAGFASWTFWPTYAGFAMGFGLWGLGGALCSGTLEALLYDGLGDSETYARTAGRGGTTAILAMLAATVLASPVYTMGGYLLVGALSVAIRAIGGFVALTLPEPARTSPDPTQAQPTQAQPTQAQPTQAQPPKPSPPKPSPPKPSPPKPSPHKPNPLKPSRR